MEVPACLQKKSKNHEAMLFARLLADTFIISGGDRSLWRKSRFRACSWNSHGVLKDSFLVLVGTPHRPYELLNLLSSGENATVVVAQDWESEFGIHYLKNQSFQTDSPIIYA